MSSMEAHSSSVKCCTLIHQYLRRNRLQRSSERQYPLVDFYNFGALKHLASRRAGPPVHLSAVPMTEADFILGRTARRARSNCRRGPRVGSACPHAGDEPVSEGDTWNRNSSTVTSRSPRQAGTVLERINALHRLFLSGSAGDRAPQGSCGSRATVLLVSRVQPDRGRRRDQARDDLRGQVSTMPALAARDARDLRLSARPQDLGPRSLPAATRRMPSPRATLFRSPTGPPVRATRCRAALR